MNIEEKAHQIIARAKVITVASIDENGFPRPVAMAKLKEEAGALYVSTGTHSAKTAHFLANSKAGVSIVEDGNSIVYTGHMSIVEDAALKLSLWGEWMLEHFPGGVSDPEYCLLKFTPESTTLWIDNVFAKDGLILNQFCQSCGMPMQTAQQHGTNADGTSNEDYCTYCYQNGAFTQDCTMDQMIDHCVNFLEEFNKSSNTRFTREEAIAQMQQYFPILKRWKKQ